MLNMIEIEEQLSALQKEFEELASTVSDTGHGAIINHGKRLEVDKSMRLTDIGKDISSSITAHESKYEHGKLPGWGNLIDPDADRIVFWDDSENILDWLNVGDSLKFTEKIIDTIQDIRTTATPTWATVILSVLTQGSLVFAGPNGLISQDNSNLFWDDTNKRLGVGTNNPDQGIEVRGISPIIRIRATGSTGNAAAYVEFGRTTTGVWVRTGYVGDAISGDENIYLVAKVNDLHLGDSSSNSVLILSGGNATFIGTVSLNFGALVSEQNSDGAEAIRIKGTSSDVDVVLGHTTGYFSVWNAADNKAVFYVNNVGDTDIAGDVGIDGHVGIVQSLTVQTIPHETTDVDKILVANSGLIKYRTGDELMSDIGLWQKNGIVLSPVTDGDRISVEDNLYSKQSDGNYFGRVHLTENQLSLDNIGSNLTKIVSEADLTAVATSSDGKYISYSSDVIPGEEIIVSDDYGVNWTRNNLTFRVYDIRMSSDGKYQYGAAHNGVYISSDKGVSWTLKLSGRYNGVDTSQDGRIVLAAGGSGTLQVSYDYGVTWTAKTDSVEWRGCGVSSDGKYMIATTRTASFIRVSSNYGDTWTSYGSDIGYTRCAISSDGKYMLATTWLGGNVEKSSDYGVTWSSTGVSSTAGDCSMIPSGKIQIITDNSNLHVSTDHGENWSVLSTDNFHKSAVSSDGKTILCMIDGTIGGGGGIYRSYADSVLQGNLTVQGRISSGTKTITAGTYDDLDVSGVNTVFVDTSGGNVIIGGTVGGVDGQSLKIVVDNPANNTTLENNEGTGNQDFFLHAGSDETLTSEYGGWNFINHGGNHWHDASHAKHV